MPVDEPIVDARDAQKRPGFPVPGFNEALQVGMI